MDSCQSATAATEERLTAVKGETMRMPALAVVGSDHQIIRSTESFRRKYEKAAALCERSRELDLVLTGQTDAAVVDLGEFSVAIEAVTDAAGERHAMLSLPTDPPSADPDPPLTALRDAADESPAMVWVKDLEGHYLYINARYARDLDTSEERLQGNTDADLPPVETVDGPRLTYTDDDLEEPLQLEYIVPAYEFRPALAVFRFPLRDRSGQPIATCGVAVPSTETQVARDEAVRLMQLERWNRLDPRDVRAELLEQWCVQAAPVRPQEAEQDVSPGEAADPAVVEEEVGLPELPEEEAEEEDRRGEQAPAASAEEPAPPDDKREDEWVHRLRHGAGSAGTDALASASDALQSDLQLARKWADRADQLQGELQDAHARAGQAQRDAQEALAAAQLAAEEANRWRVELEQTRLELDREQAESQAARAEVEVARRELGAARAQAQSLKAPADAALRLSEELGRALAAERERSDELSETLARVSARLGDFDSALAPGHSAHATGA